MRELPERATAQTASAEPKPGLVDALEQTIQALEAAGRIEPVDAARVALLRSMAALLDARGTNAQLWKVFHLALERLITGERATDDAIERAWAELSADVGDQTQT